MLTIKENVIYVILNLDQFFYLYKCYTDIFLLKLANKIRYILLF